MIKKTSRKFISYLKSFTLGRKKTLVKPVRPLGGKYLGYINEFWTARQRQSSSLHEIAYRACFKPQLPRFFIEQLTSEGDTIYDPFAGRGTTIIEAALLGRKVIANDINPLSRILTLPRLNIPKIEELEERLNAIRTDSRIKIESELLVFYHRRTLAEITSLRNYLIAKKESGQEDLIDAWIRMVATNRLSGHSSGFFSVYTLPPNQAVSATSQRKINKKRKQRPDYRNTRDIILKKSKQLIKELSLNERENLARIATTARFYTNDARCTTEIASNSVQLTVTSPPFLNVVQYPADNWLRCWFNNIDANEIGEKITTPKTIATWSNIMLEVFIELYRITHRGGWVAFEVGEVESGKVSLDEYIVPIGTIAGFQCEGILVNKQKFTKTANIWGVHNNAKGTNTNRVVLFQKE